MNGNLPSSLRLSQPRGRGLSYSPYPTPVGERMGSALMNILGLVEQARQQKRQKEIMQAIIGGKEIPETMGPEPTGSTLGRILQTIGAPFDPRRPPMGPVPLEETIAEAIAKARLEPKTAKEKLQEQILKGEVKVEDLTPGQQKLIGAYIPPKTPKELSAYQKIQEEEELARVIGAIRGKQYYLPGTLGAMMPQKIKTQKEAVQFLSTPPPGYEAYPQYKEIPEIMEALTETFPDYGKMTEKELFERAKAGDLEARAEAIKRGYLKR